MTAAYVRLINGQLVQSDAAEWARECLARQLLNRPLDARRQYLSRIPPDVADALRAAMTEIHEAGKGAP
jgi:hypothetical protein